MGTQARFGSVLNWQRLVRFATSLFLRHPKYAAHQPNESRIVFEILQRGGIKGTMVDVGAHFGGSLAPFAKSEWQILAFEPDSANRARLVQCFGHMKNIVIDPRALSDNAGENITFYRSEESTGISGLSAFRSSHVPAEKISVTTLSNIIQEYQLTDIEFLKIDTEGFDLFVLKGLDWNRTTPRAILCEFEDSKTLPLGYSFHDLVEFLREQHYHLIVSEWCPIVRYGGAHRWRRFSYYPCELHDPNAWGNIIAVQGQSLYGCLRQECNKYTHC